MFPPSFYDQYGSQIQEASPQLPQHVSSMPPAAGPPQLMMGMGGPTLPAPQPPQAIQQNFQQFQPQPAPYQLPLLPPGQQVFMIILLYA